MPAGSVRRNLFSAHLSRRSPSASQPEALPPSAHHGGPPPRHLQLQTTLFQPRLNRQGTPTTPPLSLSSSHLSSGSASPSSDLDPVQSNSRGRRQAGHEPPHMSSGGTLAETYDPTMSPNRPLSPRARANLYPNSSIVAVNPLTGRPVLPHVPTLPRRLRLTDSDDDDAEQDFGPDHDHTRDARPQYGGSQYAGLDLDDLAPQKYQLGGDEGAGTGRPSYLHAHSADDMDAHTAALGPADRAHDDEERRGHDGSERLVGALIARHRLRAKGTGAAARRSHSYHRASHPPQARTSRGHTRATRHHASLQDPGLDEGSDADNSLHNLDSQARDRFLPADDYGERSQNADADADADIESELERTELMCIIMGNLRRQVSLADAEGWMFGDSGTPGGPGTEELGVYD